VGGLELEVSVVVEERNFAKLAGEFACDSFWKRHKAGLWVGRHGEAALERARAVCSANPGTEHDSDSPWVCDRASTHNRFSSYAL
jgi:hypothetical protein